ncbi:transport protein Sec24-like CEF [Tanacetum coccineum]
MLHKSGRIDEDVSSRIKAAWMKWRAATGVLCDRNVPLKLKGKFYRVAIRPAMLYGSECWPITKALANRVEVAELRMLRWTCGKTLRDMIPNGVYRAQLEVETIINKMREGRLRWFGHVRRRSQSAPVRRVEDLVVDGLRRRGRPKLRWEDRVKQDMKELLLSEDMTSDRIAWRARISGPQSFSSRVMRSRLLFGNKNNQAVNTIAGDQEDPDVKDKQENQDDLNIAVLDQVLEESIIHTSDKVEAVPTSMVATYEEQGCQESVSGSGIYESGISGLVPQLRDAKDEPYQAMLDAAALKAKSNLLQLQVINDDLGVITSQGGPSYHMQTSEKELAVLKSPVDQESMFRRQEGMLRRQEQQQLAKDAKIQRRLWDPEIKNAFPDITLRARHRYVVSSLMDTAYWLSEQEESYRGISSSSSSSFSSALSKPHVLSFVSKTNNWPNNRSKRFDNKKFRDSSNSGNNSNNNSNNNGNNRGPNPNLLCKNCGKVGHIVDKCFDLIGYPPGQYGSLGWIIDSGAKQHMIVSTLNMYGFIDTSDLNLTVRHPNGTLAKIKYVGNLKISENVVLFDVLVVPAYCVQTNPYEGDVKLVDGKLLFCFERGYVVFSFNKG